MQNFTAAKLPLPLGERAGVRGDPAQKNSPCHEIRLIYIPAGLPEMVDERQ